MKVASLHVHGKVKNSKKEPQKMTSMKSLDLEAGKGIVQDVRYYNKAKSRNHVSLITRSLLQTYELSPGQVRSNIEIATTTKDVDVDWERLLDQELQIGKDAIVKVYKFRTPCWQMDVLQPGLQKQMRNGKQGFIAEVIKSGKIHVGDSITRC